MIVFSLIWYALDIILPEERRAHRALRLANKRSPTKVALKTSLSVFNRLSAIRCRRHAVDNQKGLSARLKTVTEIISLDSSGVIAATTVADAANKKENSPS